MQQQYDKIIKENIDALIPAVLKKVLKLNYDSIENISSDLQTTIERKPDFLKRIHLKDENKKQSYLLHIEFQTIDEAKMRLRMLEYRAILRRKFSLPVRQYVIFIGEGKAKMKTILQEENLFFQFHLVNMSDISYITLLNSSQVEEIILSILGGFENQHPTKVVKKILARLSSLEMETILKQKAVIQLEILSNLRNLQDIIASEIHNYMALNYDINKDLRYQQGIEQGIEQEKIKGILKALSQNKLALKEIAELFEVSVEYVQKLKTSNKI